MFRLLFEASATAMVVHDMAGRALAVNAACRELMGLTEEQAYANTAEDVMVPADAALREVEAERDFAGQAGGAAVHRDLVRRDGTIIRARIRKTVIDSPQGSWCW